MSRSLRARGLKCLLPRQAIFWAPRRALYGRVDWNFIENLNHLNYKESRSLRARGLKSITFVLYKMLIGGRALYGRVDWNPSFLICSVTSYGRALYGRVDWNNSHVALLLTVIKSRSLRARGLKSIHHPYHTNKNHVALFTGAWIEMIIALSLAEIRGVALFTGAWIEMALSIWRGEL